MIDIKDIIFKKRDMNVEERVLYAYLLSERVYKQSMVEYNMIKKEDITENDLYFTQHSNQELMELLKCGKSKLIRIKKSLEDKGYLKQKRVLDGVNKYFILEKEVK